MSQACAPDPERRGKLGDTDEKPDFSGDWENYYVQRSATRRDASVTYPSCRRFGPVDGSEGPLGCDRERASTTCRCDTFVTDLFVRGQGLREFQEANGDKWSILREFANPYVHCAIAQTATEMRVTWQPGDPGENVVTLGMGAAVVHESLEDVNRGHAEWHVSRWQVCESDRSLRLRKEKGTPVGVVYRARGPALGSRPPAS
eukprot:6819787-Pyramimonas_sp.AAC.1